MKVQGTSSMCGGAGLAEREISVGVKHIFEHEQTSFETILPCHDFAVSPSPELFVHVEA